MKKNLEIPIIQSKMKRILKKTLWFTVMATLCLVIVVFMLFFGVVSCGKQMSAIDDNGNEPNSENPVIEEPTNLNGTVWELYGYIYENQTKIKVPHPVDCKECYTLWFDSDYTFTALSIQRRFKLDLQKGRSQIPPTQELVCEWYDKDNKLYCDADIMRPVFAGLGCYSVIDDELRLSAFQPHGTDQISVVNLTKEQASNLNSYLLFKRIYREPPTTLKGTSWKLSGVVDCQTGDIMKLEPTDCDDCYSITFLGDSIFNYKSIKAVDTKNLSRLDLIHDPIQPWGFAGDEEPLYLYEDSHHTDVNGECVPCNDNYLFCYGIAYSKSYKLTHNELKLYFEYEEKYYYLLFKLFFK